jgi:hypothetical protein
MTVLLYQFSILLLRDVPDDVDNPEDADDPDIVDDPPPIKPVCPIGPIIPVNPISPVDVDDPDICELLFDFWVDPDDDMLLGPM